MAEPRVVVPITRVQFPLGTPLFLSFGVSKGFFRYMTKLVILRGPSGSGKSTVAKKLREKMSPKTALVEQDYLRRIILNFKEKEIKGGPSAELIFLVVKLALDNGYNVILEGILSSSRSHEMLDKLLAYHPKENYLYYFDISFNETLKRHATKDNADEYGEEEMLGWYKEKDVFSPTDRIVPEEFSLEKTVSRILQDIDISVR